MPVAKLQYPPEFKAEVILEAKNERTASLYLDGLLDTDEHRSLEADRARAEVEHQHAKEEGAGSTED